MSEIRHPPLATDTTCLYDGVDYQAIYNYYFYRRSNPDIVQALGDHPEQYIAHFVNYGMNEGRNSHPIFNVQRYKDSLNGSLGENWKPYYLDYLAKAKDTPPKKLEMNVAPEQADILKKAQECNRILLRELTRVCEKYNLKYYMICGTLLGAIRHGGFIPWDDDADVAMTRHDFDILKSVAKQEWDGKNFLFVDYSELGEDVFLDFMSRLVYVKEEVPIITFRKIEGKGRKEIQNHIPLDIYILDNASDNEKEHNRQTKLLQGLYGLCMGHRATIDFSEYADRPASMQNQIKLMVNTGRILPLKWLFSLYEKTRKKFNDRETENYIMSNGFIFCIPWKHKREWFAEGSSVLIDGEPFIAPKDWDAYLSRQYGDYSLLPAVEDRHPTHTYGATGIYHTIDYSKGKERI